MMVTIKLFGVSKHQIIHNNPPGSHLWVSNRTFDMFKAINKWPFYSFHVILGVKYSFCLNFHYILWVEKTVSISLYTKTR